MVKLISTVLILFPLNGFALVNLPAILKEVRAKYETVDEEFNVKMKIIESDRSEKDRELKIWRKSATKDQHFLLVRVYKPLDIKDLGLLVKINHRKDERWIYIPSSKQVRRLSGETSQGQILGSELYAEDFDVDLSKKTQNRILKSQNPNDLNYYVIESTTEQQSKNYSKIVSYINKSNFLLSRVNCYNKKNEHFKTLEFKNYKEIIPGKWRAENIVISNLITKRKTELNFSSIKLNQNLKDIFFHPQNLAD